MKIWSDAKGVCEKLGIYNEKGDAEYWDLIVGLLLFYLYQALFSHKMFELELFQAGTHADGF